MADATDRAVAALEDVVAVERIAPGLLRVVTWSDAYPVDARGAGCNCPDKQYNEPERCKHELGALLATSDLPTPFTVTDNLSDRVATDGMGVSDAGPNDRPPADAVCEDCERLPDDFPCVSCVISGDKEIPDKYD